MNLRETLALRRIQIMRVRSMEQRLRQVRTTAECPCALCVAKRAGGQVLSLGDVLRTIAGDEPAVSTPAGGKAH